MTFSNRAKILNACLGKISCVLYLKKEILNNLFLSSVKTISALLSILEADILEVNHFPL